MEPKFKIGQIVYEYSPYRSYDCIKPVMITAIYWTQNNIEYILDDSRGRAREKDLFISKNELIDMLIEEENKDHERRVKELVSAKVEPFKEG